LIDAIVAVTEDAASRVVVGHVDHQLRPDSARDAEHVRLLAASLGVRCVVAAVDVPELARVERIGVEEAARVGRYRSLSSLAKEIGTGILLTAHTRSDNVETVLMHVLRGSGTRGLRGMQVRDWLDARLVASQSDLAGTRFASIDSRKFAVAVVRPLLARDRADTTAYCAARGLVWCLDPSNADARFLRNRIRHHLLPVLRTYNPAVDSAIDRLARLVDEDERFLATIVDQRFRTLAQQDDDGMLRFDLDSWRHLWLSIQRRLVLRVASELGVDDVGFEVVRRALAVADESGPPRADLGSGLMVERASHTLAFQIVGDGAGGEQRHE